MPPDPVQGTDPAAPQGGSQTATTEVAGSKPAEGVSTTATASTDTAAADAAKAAEDATAKKIRELEKDNKKYRDEAKTREDAQLSETERLTKKATEEEARATKNEEALKELRLQQAVDRAAMKAGVVDPEGATLMLDRSLLEVGDDGTPSKASVDAALEELKGRKAYLFGAQGPTGSADGGSRTPQVADIDADAQKLLAAGKAPDAVALKVKAFEAANQRRGT